MDDRARLYHTLIHSTSILRLLAYEASSLKTAIFLALYLARETFLVMRYDLPSKLPPYFYKVVLRPTLRTGTSTPFLLQVLYVYIFSGAYKWASEQWRSGEAVFDILHLKEFSLPWIMKSLDQWYGLFVLVNYIAMIYFSLFPFLVWSKRWKIPMLLFGVIWHLGMGWTIGVMDFSFIMIASYAAFLEKDDINKVKNLFTKRIKVSQT